MSAKKLIYLLMVLVLFSCGQKKNDKLSSDLVNNPNTASGNASDNLPKFQFAEETHDFGKIIQGEKVTYFFKFKNAGKSDLLIFNATASCGCTVPLSK